MKFQAFQQMLWDGPDGAGAERVDVATSQTVSTLHINCNSVRSGGGAHGKPEAASDDSGSRHCQKPGEGTHVAIGTL